MSAALYAAAVAAFDEAGWRHGDPNPYGTLGTSILLDRRLVGGSLQVHGTVVEFVAFGTAAGDDRAHAFAELFAVVNRALPAATFELDPNFGPVCRSGADLAGALDEAGVPKDEATVRDLVLGLATTATGVFEGFVNVLEDVAAGADPAAVLEAHGWSYDLVSGEQR